MTNVDISRDEFKKVYRLDFDSTEICNIYCQIVAGCNSFNFDLAAKDCQLISSETCSVALQSNSAFVYSPVVYQNPTAYGYFALEDQEMVFSELHTMSSAYNTAFDGKKEYLVPDDEPQVYSHQLDPNDFGVRTECQQKMKSVKICQGEKVEYKLIFGGIDSTLIYPEIYGYCEQHNSLFWDQNGDISNCTFSTPSLTVDSPCQTIYFKRNDPTYLKTEFFFQIQFENGQLSWSKIMENKDTIKSQSWELECPLQTIVWKSGSSKKATVYGLMAQSFPITVTGSNRFINTDNGINDEFFLDLDLSLLTSQLLLKNVQCGMYNLEIYSDQAQTQLITSDDAGLLQSDLFINQCSNSDLLQTCKVKILLSRGTKTFYPRLVNSQDASQQWNFELTVNICGYESVNQDLTAVPLMVRSNLQDNFTIPLENIASSVVSTVPTCPISDFSYFGTSFDQLEANFTGEYPNQYLSISTHSVTNSGTYNVLMTATTKGLVKGQFKVQVEVWLVSECLLCIIGPSFGPTKLQTSPIVVKNTFNDIEIELKKKDLFLLGGLQAFIFEEFNLLNMTYTNSESCQKREYELQLEYYRFQTPISSFLGKSSLAKHQFVRMNKYSSEPSKLLTSPAMKHYDTESALATSASLLYEINQLDNSKLYNMITFNPDQLAIKNMTYLMKINVKQPSTFNDTSLSRFLKSIDLSYQFSLPECHATSFQDKSENQTAFGNEVELVYFINNGTQEIESPFKDLIGFLPRCGDSYQVYQYIDYNNGRNSSEVQKIRTIIKYDDVEGKFKIYAFSKSQTGIHHLYMRAQVRNHLNLNKEYPQFAEWSFKLNVKIEEFVVINQKAPYFDQSQIKLPQIITATKKTSLPQLYLPPMKDSNFNQSVSLILGNDVSQYVRYQKKSHSLIFSDYSMSMTSSKIIRIIINDDSADQLNNIYNIQLYCSYCQKVINETQDEIMETKKVEVTTNETKATQRDIEPPFIKIKPVTNDGVLSFEFTKKMVYPKAWEEKFEKDKEILKDLESGGKNTSRMLQDEEIDPKYDLNVTAFTEITDEEQEKIELQWYIKQLEPEKVEIVIYFESPETISLANQDIPDNLAIGFPESLEDEDGMKVDFTQHGGTNKITKKLPAQMPRDEETKEFKSNIQVAEKGAQSVIFFNFLLKLVLQLSLNYLWGMINTLQMVIYLPMFNLNFPANVSIFNSIMITIATFDIVPSTEDFYSFNHTLAEVDQKATGYELLGFENKNFLINTGSLYLYVIGFVVQGLRYVILKRMAHHNIRHVERYQNFARDKLFSQWITVFLIEGYIELFMSAILQAEQIPQVVKIFTNGSDIFSFIMGIIFFILYLILPLLSTWVIKRKQRFLEMKVMEQTPRLKYLISLEEKEFDNTYGAFYDGLKLLNNSSLQHWVVYIIRRMIFVLTCYYFQDYVFLQLQVNMALNLANLMYLIWSQAFIEKQVNRNDIFNEICVMVVGYFLTGFSDMVLDAGMKNKVGMWMITLTLGNMAFNFIQIIFMIVYQFRLQILHWYYKKEDKRIRKQLNAKYSPQEQTLILRSIRQGKTIRQVKRERRKMLIAWKLKHIESYKQAEEMSDSDSQQWDHTVNDPPTPAPISFNQITDQEKINQKLQAEFQKFKQQELIETKERKTLKDALEKTKLLLKEAELQKHYEEDRNNVNDLINMIRKTAQ